MILTVLGLENTISKACYLIKLIFNQTYIVKMLLNATIYPWYLPIVFSDTEGYCDIEGLKCLTDHFGKRCFFLKINKVWNIIVLNGLLFFYISEIVNRIHAKGYDKPGLICECLPSCTEPEYTIVSDLKKYEEQTDHQLLSVFILK